MATQDLTQDALKSHLSYDHETGLFIRLRNGRVAGNKRDDGYITIGVNYRRYYAHRLAWLYVHGYMPTTEIDHINQNTSDNRISNLREASKSQNQANVSKMPAKNTSGYRGVYWHKARGKWAAQMMHKGEMLFLGLYSDPVDASNAYVKKARELRGDYCAQ